MGILDDAIRQHLDLKRRLGAEEDELARLEGEAFGPPTRPGEPDFPERAEGPDSEAGEPGAAAPSEPPAQDGPSEEDPAPAEPEPEPEPAPAEPEPAGFFNAEAQDAEPVEDLDLDLDLELDLEDEPAPAVQVAPPQPESPASEVPIESRDTVEHHFAGALDEAEVVEDEPAAQLEETPTPTPPPTPAPPVVDEPPAAADEDADEDVLEETPEFLRDQPEDDELWFEQGEPKDFDF